MELHASRHCTIPCAHCGRAAAELALLPAGDRGEPARANRDRLERTDFMGTVTRFGRSEELTQLFEAIARGDFEAARAIDADFVAFVCRGCEAAYCDQCWRLQPPVFEGGFYDYTPATCPEGHQQVIDD